MNPAGFDLVPVLPVTAPFTPDQRAWLNGYSAGRFASFAPASELAPSSAAPKPSLLILYGSQSGSAEALARRLAAEAGSKGFEARLFEANSYEKAAWAKESRLLLVSSTWGEGDPPDNAAQFWAHLNSPAAPPLAGLEYAVLALGDKNYSDFCGAGKKFDDRLRELGGKPLCPRAECDVDYQAAAKAWCESLWPLLCRAVPPGAPQPAGSAVPKTPSPVQAAAAVESKPAGHTRENPFPAKLLLNRPLNGSGSAKETRHYEFSLEGSDLAYEAGDALGVVPSNCRALVKEILGALGFDGEEAVTDPSGRETSLGRALLDGYQITQPPEGLLKLLAERSADQTLRHLLRPENKEALGKFLFGREVIDLLLQFKPASLEPGELVACLRKLQPRLYSIASSPKAHAGQVHLTVSTVRYESFGRERKGVCSTFLADRAVPGGSVPVFVQKSPNFKLPPDGSRPVIMIGPGTGIAPFRAFLHERLACGHGGRNWLFFGEQCAARDFLYREELAEMARHGHLTRLDTAFSRDQARKIYVQDRMREQTGEFWKWIENGAHVYVCGDAKRMAKDVDAALHEIIRSSGGRSEADAAAFVQEMKAARRYQRDVY
jgi:sulfite reductase (NADPH) flavoprotein alpha-component